MGISEVLSQRPYETRIRRTFWPSHQSISWAGDKWAVNNKAYPADTYEMTPADLISDDWERKL